MAQVESRSRARVTAYTSALIIAVASSVYLAVVPFLPAPPVFPILVGLGLGALSLRNRGISVAALYLLVYFSVLWQMIGFGFFQLLSASVGVAVLLAMAVPLIPFMTKRVELSSMALAVLAVALMLTPAYFVSIPLVAAAALTFGGFASLEALAAAFVFLLTPFLLLENALYFTTTSGATAPIIFGQFTLLSQNLRPPLPGLNVLLTGLPADYLSHSALPGLDLALPELRSPAHPDGRPRSDTHRLLVGRRPRPHLYREVREVEGDDGEGEAGARAPRCGGGHSDRLHSPPHPPLPTRERRLPDLVDQRPVAPPSDIHAELLFPPDHLVHRARVSHLEVRDRSGGHRGARGADDHLLGQDEGRAGAPRPGLDLGPLDEPERGEEVDVRVLRPTWRTCGGRWAERAPR